MTKPAKRRSGLTRWDREAGRRRCDGVVSDEARTEDIRRDAMAYQQSRKRQTDIDWAIQEDRECRI
jgi:hypothetical protein